MPRTLSSAGQDVIDLAASVGLALDPWQQYVLRGALGEKPDGTWQAFEVGLIVPRQNGKGAILEALELAWLFMFDDDRLILHSSHEFKTTREAFLRLVGLIDGSDELRKRVRQTFAPTGGEAGIELLDGTRLRFVARSKGSGRGMSPQKLVLDEAYNLPESVVDAILPTVGAQSNAQVWYTSSPGDYNIAPCDALARVRRRGLKGDDDSLAYFEWSVEYNAEGVVRGDPGDHRLWAQANPSLGIRKTVDRIENFYRSMSPAGFQREELGVGTWPLDAAEGSLFDMAAWATSRDTSSQIISDLNFALDVSPSLSTAAIAAAGLREDGLTHIEVTGRDGLLDHRPGIDWVVPRLTELAETFPQFRVIVAKGSAAKVLLPALDQAGIRVTTLDSSDVAAACGLAYAEVAGDRVRHLGQVALSNAVANAAKNQEDGEGAWKFGRRKSSGDITPLYAAALALYAAHRDVSANYDVAQSVW